MQRASMDSGKFMSLSYVLWAAVKTIVVFSVLIHLGQKRYNLVNGFYNNKQACQKCYDTAKANGNYEFEFTRCVKSFDMPSDSSNIHKGEAHGWNYDSTLALEDNYVVLPGIFLGLSILMWCLAIGLVYLVGNINLTLLLSFMWNFLSAFLLLYCTSVIYMLYLHDFGGGVECYVHVIGKKFQLAISSVIVVFVGLELVRWCLVERNSATYHTLFLSQICIVFILMILYTAQAGMAAKQGVYESVIFALIAWQIATEIPSLAVICKTLFDLSAALRNYGMLPGGQAPNANNDEENNGDEHAGLLAQNNNHGSISGTRFVGEARRV